MSGLGRPGAKLEVADVGYAFGAVRALHGVSFTAEPGRITCVMGRNGVGKTTLLRSLMGTWRHEGAVRLDGRDVSALPAHRRARAGIALVPQGREIFPRLSVEENLLVGLEASGAARIPDGVWGIFPILKSFAKRMGGDLSGGQQQQLAIARALVGNPQVLLLDEPTEGIQPNIIHEIGVLLRRLARETGLTVVLVEQYLDFVREFGDAYAVMDRGRIVASGEVATLDAEVVQRHLAV